MKLAFTVNTFRDHLLVNCQYDWQLQLVKSSSTLCSHKHHSSFPQHQAETTFLVASVLHQQSGLCHSISLPDPTTRLHKNQLLHQVHQLGLAKAGMRISHWKIFDVLRTPNSTLFLVTACPLIYKKAQFIHNYQYDFQSIQKVLFFRPLPFLPIVYTYK